MEWAVLLAFAAIALALVAMPTRRAPSPPDESATLEGERRLLLSELRELDEDAAAGRISSEDRQAGRRAIAPRLRAVTEALRSTGSVE
jgi:cytochrome c-type biogenesis protein CcmI